MVMHSRDIAWLGIVSLLGLNLAVATGRAEDRAEVPAVARMLSNGDQAGDVRRDASAPPGDEIAGNYRDGSAASPAALPATRTF